MYMTADNIKITKVKPWAIYFNYRDRKFLLHESSDCYEYSTCLYERKFIKNGKYKLESIKRYYGRIFTLNWYSSKKGRTYNQIDKEAFLRKLIYHEMVNNKIVKKEIEKLKEDAKKYRNLEQEYREKAIIIEYKLFR